MRSSPLARWIVCSALLSSPTLLAGDARAQKPPATAVNPEAKALFDKGMALSAESRWAEALEAFEASNKIAPVPVVQYNIAYNLRTLGRYVEAKQRLQALLDAAPGAKPPLKPSLKQDIDQLFSEVKDKVVRLSVKLDPPDGDLQVDGTPTKLPPDGALEFDPGKHVFVIKKPGYETTSITKTLSSADSSLVLQAPKVKTETRIVEREKIVEPPSRPFYTRGWFWTVAGVVVIGGAAAVYLATRPGDQASPQDPPTRTVDRIIPTAIRF